MSKKLVVEYASKHRKKKLSIDQSNHCQIIMNSIQKPLSINKKIIIISILCKVFITIFLSERNPMVQEEAVTSSDKALNNFDMS